MWEQGKTGTWRDSRAKSSGDEAGAAKAVPTASKEMRPVENIVAVSIDD